MGSQKADDPLLTALATAFADSPVPDRRSAPSTFSSPSFSSSTAPEAPPIPSETEMEGEASWKKDYDQLLSGWRAESATARERAEKERDRWRVIREEEEQERKREQISGSDGRARESKETEWETVGSAGKSIDPKTKPTPDRAEEQSHSQEAIQNTPPGHGPSPIDVVTGETLDTHSVGTLESLLPHLGMPSTDSSTASRLFHAEASIPAPAPPSSDLALSTFRTWEEVPSLDSSFPSLSFPDRSAAVSPEPRDRRPHQPPLATPSVTLAIFDSSLSTRTRVLALVSSLAINMFLPFVNGVMLGFGEIFAKNVITFFGWTIPGAALGIHAAPRRSRR